MSSPISRRPGGFLDLLLTQQQGKNPGELLDTVQPSIDMLPFYCPERLTISTATNAVTTKGIQANAVEIPAGENWLVYGVGFFIEFQTGTQYIGPACLARVGTKRHSLGWWDPTDIDAVVGTNEGWYLNENLPQPLIFPSGAKFEMNAAVVALGGQPNLNTIMSVMYTRMET